MMSVFIILTFYQVLIYSVAHSENHHVCRCGFFVPQYTVSLTGTQMKQKFKARSHLPRYHSTTSSMPSAPRPRHSVSQVSRNMPAL